MATVKVRASNIDKNRPIVTKTVIEKALCPKCDQYTVIKMEITANALAKVVVDQTGECGNKKCNGRVGWAFSVVMPKK